MIPLSSNESNARTDILTARTILRSGWQIKPPTIATKPNGPTSGINTQSVDGDPSGVQMPTIVSTITDGLNPSPYGNAPVIAPLAITAKTAQPGSAAISNISPVTYGGNAIVLGVRSVGTGSNGPLDDSNRQDSQSIAPPITQNNGVPCMSASLVPVTPDNVVPANAVVPGTSGTAATGNSTANTPRANIFASMFSGNGFVYALLIVAVFLILRKAI